MGSRLLGSWPETGFKTISLQLSDPSDRGVGGRQYGASEDIETLKGKNNASTGRSRAVEAYRSLRTLFFALPEVWTQAFAVGVASPIHPLTV
jgi:hypothetical protein